MRTSRLWALVSVLLWIAALGTPFVNSFTGNAWLVEILVEAPGLYPVAAIPLAVAVAVAVTRPPVALAVTAIAVGAVFAVLVIAIPMGVTIWDGVDAQGRPIGGMEVDTRHIGWYCALACSLALAIAGVLGLRDARAGRRR